MLQQLRNLRRGTRSYFVSSGELHQDHHGNNKKLQEEPECWKQSEEEEDGEQGGDKAFDL